MQKKSKNLLLLLFLQVKRGWIESPPPPPPANFTILLNYVVGWKSCIFLVIFLSKSVFGFFKTKKRRVKKIPMATKLEGEGVRP